MIAAHAALMSIFATSFVVGKIDIERGMIGNPADPHSG